MTRGVGYTAEVADGCDRSSSVLGKRSFLTIEPFYFAQLGEIFMRVYKIVIQP